MALMLPCIYTRTHKSDEVDLEGFSLEALKFLCIPQASVVNQ